jgi:integrase
MLLKNHLNKYHAISLQTKISGLNMGVFRLRKDKNGRNRYQYIIELHRSGRRIYKSKTFDTKREALQWEKKFLYEVDAGIITKESLKKRKVSDGIQKYISTVLSQRPKNARNVLQHLKWWENRIGNYQLSEVIPALCAECRDQLLKEVGPKGKVRKSGTALRYIATMSAVFEYCMKDWMWISQNPLRAIKKPSPGRRKTRFFTLNEISKIYNLCASSNSIYMLPIFTIAIHTGMRRGEILSLRWENIDFPEREIHLPTSKNGEPRDIAMTNDVYKALSELALSNDSRNFGLVFPSPNDPQKPVDIKSTWERVLQKAGITDGSFHTIRHSTCSYLASLNISPTLIARIVGHKDSRTTDIYIDAVKSHRHEVMQQLESLIPVRNQ